MAEALPPTAALVMRMERLVQLVAQAVLVVGERADAVTASRVAAVRLEQHFQEAPAAAAGKAEDRRAALDPQMVQLAARHPQQPRRAAAPAIPAVPVRLAVLLARTARAGY